MSDPWGRLVDTHGAAIYRYLRRRLVGAADPHADAEELSVEVFVVAWRQDRPDADLPWLYGVARRVLANHRRRRVDIPVADLPDDDDAGDPADLITDDLALAAAWRRLPARDREILRLVAWEGLSGAELAEVLQIGVGGAGAALSRARARLASELAIEEASDTGAD